MNINNIEISFDVIPSIQDSIALKELGESLEKADISSEPQLGQQKDRVKDGGLTVGLTITALALTAVGNLISAISLWGSKRNYSITFKTGDVTFAANNLKTKEALAIVQAIKDKAVASDIKVLVSRK